MADPLITSSAISAGASLLGAGTSAIATGNLNKKNRAWQEQQAAIQRQWNESMYERQNAWNYEMWLKEQEYNNPSNQLQRLRDAGLNPLYYGLDGNSVGSAPMAAQPLGYERASSFAVDNPVSVGMSAASTVAQSTLAFASARRAEKEGDLSAEKAITEVLMRDRQYDFLGVQIDLGKSEEKVNENQARKLASEINSIEKQVQKMDADIMEAYSRIDVAQRGQKLAEDSFEFSKAIQNANLSLREKEIAVDWYNANTQRLIGDADIQLKEQQKVYVQIEGEQVKAVTQTENALRSGKVERQNIENKTAEREYKWMPVDKTVKAVGTAAGIAGGIMLGAGKVTGTVKAAKAAKSLATRVPDENGYY